MLLPDSTTTQARSSWAPEFQMLRGGAEGVLLWPSWPPPTLWFPTCLPGPVWYPWGLLNPHSQAMLRSGNRGREKGLIGHQWQSWDWNVGPSPTRVGALGHVPFPLTSEPSSMLFLWPGSLFSPSPGKLLYMLQYPFLPGHPGQVRCLLWVPPALCLCNHITALVSTSYNCLFTCPCPPLDCEPWEGRLGLSWSSLHP